MLPAVLLVVASLLTAACGATETISEGPNVPFATLAQSNSSGVTSSEGVVARNQTEFNALWVRHSANSSPLPPAPSVNFNAFQVVAYFLGTRSNGCYSISITRVTRTSDRLVVTYKEQVPAAGVLCTANIVSPAHLVVVPQSQLQVEFVAE